MLAVSEISDGAKVEVLQALISNAERLRRDAQILLASGRYASAVAMAVMALEEVGRSLIMAEAASDRRGRHDARVAVPGSAASLRAGLDFARARFREPTAASGDAASCAPVSYNNSSARLARFLETVDHTDDEHKDRAIRVGLDDGASWSIVSTPDDIAADAATEWVVLAYEVVQAGSPLVLAGAARR